MFQQSLMYAFVMFSLMTLQNEYVKCAEIMSLQEPNNSEMKELISLNDLNISDEDNNELIDFSDLIALENSNDEQNEYLSKRSKSIFIDPIERNAKVQIRWGKRFKPQTRWGKRSFPHTRWGKRYFAMRDQQKSHKRGPQTRWG